VFYFAIANMTQDTILVKLNNRNGEARFVERFSTNNFLINPNEVKLDTVFYKWLGQDVCFIDCGDTNANGNAFVAQFYNGKIKLSSKCVVPCVPCDSLVDWHLIDICKDCPYEVRDTLYFTGN